MSDSLKPRRAALHLLDEVLIERRLLSEALGAGALTHLDGADRARAQRLALSTLRALGRADRWLKPHLKKRPPEAVQNVLRLGVVEIAEGASAHGVVNDLVEIIGANKRLVTYKGLVNAVLRKAEGIEWGKLPMPQIPTWLRGPLVEAWGNRAVTAIESVQFKQTPLDITVKENPALWAEKLAGEVLATGSVRLPAGRQVTALEGYAEGAWWVQDASAALPAKLLAPQKGERILDMCAAPGGKTMQLAEAGAEVTALDISENRLKRVSENLTRTGLSATIVQGDATEFSEAGWDAILLDAPCSATGTMRRHPDLPHAKDGSEIGYLIELQTQLIDHALSLLKPGGRLLFCTCALIPDEGEVQIDEALERNPELEVIRPDAEALGINPDWITEEGGIRLRPDYLAEKGGMDGFYMALLRKPL